MKYLILLVAVLGLNSCNTLIGMGRDTKEAYIWTKGKFENTGANTGGGYQDPYGTPVY